MTVQGCITTTAWDWGAGEGAGCTQGLSDTPGHLPSGLSPPRHSLSQTGLSLLERLLFLPDPGFPCPRAQASESQVVSELYSYCPEFQWRVSKPLTTEAFHPCPLLHALGASLLESSLWPELGRNSRSQGNGRGEAGGLKYFTNKPWPCSPSPRPLPHCA